ncbi:hypothetical protein SAMN05421879_10153 [Ornithinimicrobium cerasi]|uniref:Uncharacterized protein n=1 Tax=Ornithinimicrobium cerasi TaxID=2248773 RepID=A0A285VB10_9MICO|nr:hypothetical protein SAMN05421879_10153 [Ornithinimicrobium cerasi]
MAAIDLPHISSGVVRSRPSLVLSPTIRLAADPFCHDPRRGARCRPLFLMSAHLVGVSLRHVVGRGLDHRPRASRSGSWPLVPLRGSVLDPSFVLWPSSWSTAEGVTGVGGPGSRLSGDTCGWGEQPRPAGGVGGCGEHKEQEVVVEAGEVVGQVYRVVGRAHGGGEAEDASFAAGEDSCFLVEPVPVDAVQGGRGSEGFDPGAGVPGEASGLGSDEDLDGCLGGVVALGPCPELSCWNGHDGHTFLSRVFVVTATHRWGGRDPGGRCRGPRPFGLSC